MQLIRAFSVWFRLYKNHFPTSKKKDVLQRIITRTVTEREADQLLLIYYFFNLSAEGINPHPFFELTSRDFCLVFFSTSRLTPLLLEAVITSPFRSTLDVCFAPMSPNMNKRKLMLKAAVQFYCAPRDTFWSLENGD